MLFSKRASAVLAASLLTLTCQGALAADSLNFVSWGGTTQDAQKQAWAEPFSASSKIRVVQDGPTDYGKLKAMVESGNVQWDVVDVEADFALRAASEGLLEPLDFNSIQRDRLDPRFVSDHGVGSFFFSFVLGWWGGGAQSQQLLASGEASLGQFWNGRVYALCLPWPWACPAPLPWCAGASLAGRCSTACSPCR